MRTRNVAASRADLRENPETAASRVIAQGYVSTPCAGHGDPEGHGCYREHQSVKILNRRGQLSPEGLQKSVDGTKRQVLTGSKAVFHAKESRIDSRQRVGKTASVVCMRKAN
jgi:hypothetical protein